MNKYRSAHNQYVGTIYQMQFLAMHTVVCTSRLIETDKNGYNFLLLSNSDLRVIL